MDKPETQPSNAVTAGDEVRSRRARLASRFLRITDSVARVVALVSVAAIMIHVLLNVVLRSAFRMSAPGTLEFTQYWYLPVFVFFGILSAQVHNENLRADILFSRFTPLTRLWLARTTNVVSAAMCAVLGYYTLQRALLDFGYRTTTQGQPIEIWQVSFVYPLCYFVLALIFLAQLVLPGLADVPEDAAAAGSAEVREIVESREDETADSAAAPVAARSEAAATIQKPSRSKTMQSRVILIVLLVVVLGSAGTMFLPLGGQAIGLLGIAMMLGMLFLRVPIAISLILPAAVAMFAMRGARTTEGMLSLVSFDAVPKWSLIVIPMFVFMGFLIWRSGITSDLYGAARNWLGWLPGGLAIGTNTAGTGLAAISGSTLGTTYALGRIGIPEMIKSGYDPRVAIASVMSAGLPGQLIPPSIMLVIYAGIAETSIGNQLLAGVVPGVIVSIIFGISFAVFGALKPNMVGRGSGRGAQRIGSLDVSWAERFLSLGRTWPVVILIGFVIVGMYSGVLTATEVGAAAAFLALIITVTKLRKNRPLGVIANAAVETARSTGSIFFLLIGANALSRMLSLSGLSGNLAEFIGDLGLDRIQFLLILILFYLILGMFLDPLAMMLLTIPVLMPTLSSLDISLVWFGVFIVFMAELAILTPPVGILSYVIHAIVQDREVSQGRKLGLGTVFSAAIAIVPVSMIFLLVLIFFPEVVTFLPDMGDAAD